MAVLISQQALLFFGVSIAVFVALAAFTSALRRRNLPVAEPLAGFTYLLVPTAFILGALLLTHELRSSDWWVKILKTVVGIEVIWILLSSLKALFLWRSSRRVGPSRIPVLFLDVVRLALVALGSAFVVAAVWRRDLTQFLTTLGIGSIVLGLALQETLGNFFAGIALFFERPFKVGDWIRVGEREGEVVEANWRSVRVRDRNQNMIIIPNSILGRERIENFSAPTSVCGIVARFGFAYDNPPNKVKKVLLDVLAETPNVLKEPQPSIRTKDFGDFAVSYETKYFINDYSLLHEIEEDLRTRVWYSARRHGLTIPYPTQTVYETKVPLEAKADPVLFIRKTLSKVPLFEPLLPEELSALADEVLVVEYGDRECVVKQGEAGDSLFIVRKGNALVTIEDNTGFRRHVKHLGPGDFFGEMALLTGEARTATVTAAGDLELLVVYKEALSKPFAARPALLAAMAQAAASRKTHLEIIRTTDRDTSNHATGRDGSVALMARIKSFFGIGASN